MLFNFIAKHALHVTDIRMDGQTDRITTAKTALALLRRAVNKNRSTRTLGLVDPETRGPQDKWDDTPQNSVQELIIEMRYPNVTLCIILPVYLFTTEQRHTCIVP